MADKLKNWIQKYYHGGYGKNRFVGIESSYQTAKKVEIRQNIKYFELSKAAEKDSGSVVTDLVLAMVTIKSTGNKIAFGDTGKIYRNSGGSWVNCYTDSANRKILNAYEYNGWLIWATSGNIHRISVANIDADWSGDVTEDYKTFLNGNSNAHPAIEVWNKLYFGDGSNLAELDSSFVWTNDKLKIFGDEEIRNITFRGSVLRMYSRKSAAISFSRLYLWNGTATNYNEAIPFSGKAVHSVIGTDNQDYVIAGKRPKIYSIRGYELAPLKELPDISDSQDAVVAPNALAFEGENLYIGLCESGANSIARGLWTWGRKDKDFPYSLNFEYPTSAGGATDVVGCVHSSNGVVYFSWKSGSTYGIDKVNTAKYALSGELISRAFDGQEPDQKKQVMAVKLAYFPLNSGEKIELYVRKNLSSAWGSPILTVDAAVSEDLNTIFKELTDPFSDQAFAIFETKTVLTAGTNQLTTPKVLQTKILYEDIE